MVSLPIFDVLDAADVGAYAVAVDKTILYWNRRAQEILGFSPEDVVGRHCNEVLAGQVEGRLTPACQNGCPSIHCLRAGQIPTRIELQMLSVTGDRKPVFLTPVVIGSDDIDAPVLVHLLEEVQDAEDQEKSTASVWTELAGKGYHIMPEYFVPSESLSDTPSLTKRELEVLRLVSLGMQVSEISERLHISPHTVRNHIRHFRQKLRANSRLDAVVHALRLGILELE